MAVPARVRRPGKIARLPEEARELIGGLLKAGRTLDEILAKLRELDLPAEDLPGRTALGRWARRNMAIVDEMRRQQEIGQTLVERYGEAGDSRTARMNIAMAQGLLTRLMFTEDGEFASLDAKEANFIADSIYRLTTAAKTDTDRETKLRAEAEKKARAEAAKAVEQVSKSAGLSADLINKLKAGVFGKDAA